MSSSRIKSQQRFKEPRLNGTVCQWNYVRYRDRLVALLLADGSKAMAALRQRWVAGNRGDLVRRFFSDDGASIEPEHHASQLAEHLLGDHSKSCDAHLRPHNRSGLCRIHYQTWFLVLYRLGSPKWLQRHRSAESSGPAKRCRECRLTKLRRDNKSGLCIGCAEKLWKVANPEKVKGYSSTSYQRHQPEIRAKAKAKYDQDPDQARATNRRLQKRWRKGLSKDERAEIRRRDRESQARNRSEKKSLIELAKSVIAQRHPAHRPMEQITKARLLLAAVLSIEGLSKRAIGNQLYSKQSDPEARYDSAKKLFRQYHAQIDTEKRRLTYVSQESRKAEAERARVFINR